MESNGVEKCSPHQFLIKEGPAKSISSTQVERNAVEVSLSKQLSNSSSRKRVNFIERTASVKEDIERVSSRYSKLADKSLKCTGNFDGAASKTIRDEADTAVNEKKRFCKNLATTKRKKQATNTPKGRNNGNMSDSSHGGKGKSEFGRSSERTETLHPKEGVSNEVSRLNLFEKLNILRGPNNKYEAEKGNSKKVQTSNTTMAIEFTGKRQNNLKATDSCQNVRGDKKCLTTKIGKYMPECVNKSNLKAETSQKFHSLSCSADLPPVSGCSEKRGETRQTTDNAQKRNHDEHQDDDSDKTRKRHCKSSPKVINKNNMEVRDKGQGDEPAKLESKLQQIQHKENDAKGKNIKRKNENLFDPSIKLIKAMIKTIGTCGHS